MDTPVMMAKATIDQQTTYVTYRERPLFVF